MSARMKATTALLLACTLALPLRAAADPVNLPVGPDNGFVAVYVAYNDGASAFTNVVQLDGTGHGTFTPPNQSHVSKFIAINVGTTKPKPSRLSRLKPM